LGAAITLTVSAGASSALAGYTSTSPKDKFSGIGDEYERPGSGGELDYVDPPAPDDIPIEVRGHSDVPDLPDIGGDGSNSSSNSIGFLPNPGVIPDGSAWLFERPIGQFDLSSQALDRDTVAVLSPSSSPVPSPSGLVALGVAVVVTGTRRRR